MYFSKCDRLGLDRSDEVLHWQDAKLAQVLSSRGPLEEEDGPLVMTILKEYPTDSFRKRTTTVLLSVANPCSPSAEYL